MNRIRWIFFWAVVIVSGSVLPFIFSHKFAKQQVKPSKGFYLPLKIEGFSTADIPYVEVEIEERKILLQVDTGFEGYISLLPELINELEKKTFIRTRSTKGLNGKAYESKVYEVPQIEWEEGKIKRLLAEEVNSEFEEDITVSRDLSKTPKKVPICGRIGWRFFQRYNVLLDCDHSKIVICKNGEDLHSKGISIESFVECPLLLDRGAIEFVATTDLGPLQCILDSGSTFSLLKKKEEKTVANGNFVNFDFDDITEMNQFQISGVEFGPQKFYNVNSPMEFGAIIGMDFIRDHLIYIDFGARKIYFQKSKSET